METYWMETEVKSLKGKTAAITGATGDLGKAVCRRFLSYGADLIMIVRNEGKAELLKRSLQKDYPEAKISWVICDLQDMESVKAACETLSHLSVDLLMLNAGTYAIPSGLSSAGFDTVFQVNFLSHYYMIKKLLPKLQERKAKVVVTGSIAHKFNPLDPADPDFSHHEGANNIYGNAKRFLMFALMELCRQEGVDFAIGHPGISYTGITSNYPPEALAVVKPSMELLFEKPEKACLSMVRAAFAAVPYGHWIGPGYFDIWGAPVISPLHSCSTQERRKIFKIAEEMARGLS